MKGEFFKFTRFDIGVITVLLVLFGAFLGYYLGTQHNFETRAITKHYSWFSSDPGSWTAAGATG